MTAPTRTVEAKLRLDSSQFESATKESARSTARLADAAQRAQSRTDRAFASMGRSAERTEADIDQLADELTQAADAAGVSAREMVDLAAALGTADAAAGRAADGLDDTTRQARQLDAAIEAVSGELAELNRRMVATGDITLFGDVAARRGMLGHLRRLRRELGDVAEVGQTAGRGFVRTFGDALGGLPPRVRGAVIVGVAGGALAAAPLLGGAIAAAVLGGVGAGGIIGGVVSASRDQRVQAAAQDLVDQLQRPFDELGSAFVGPVRQSLRILADAGEDLLDDLMPDLQALAPVVVDLAEGLAGMMQEAGPGLGAALEAAVPILQQLAVLLPSVGDALSDMLTMISSESDGAILALQTIVGLVNFLLRSVGVSIAMWSDLFARFVDFAKGVGTLGAGLPIVGDQFARLRAAAIELQSGLTDAGTAGETAGRDLAGGFQAAEEQIAATNAIMQRHHDLLRAQTDPMFALINAQTRLGETQTAYNEAVERFGRHSPEAEAALLSVTEAAINLDGAAGDAAGAFDGKLSPALRDALAAAGVTEQQMADLLGITEDSHAELEAWERDYNASAHLDFVTTFRQFGDPPPVGLDRLASTSIAVGRNVAFRHGGIVEHADRGLLRDAAVFSTRAPAMFAFAEPATGGEAFIPRFGDADRSLAILEHAAGWYGHTVTPAPETGRQPPATTHVFSPTYHITPKTADFSVRDLEATLAVQEARQRVGRPR